MDADTTDRMDVDGSSTSGGAPGTSSSSGADTLAIPRNRILRANLHTFTQRYCLLLSTFAMAIKELGSAAGLVYVAKPLYTFNPAHLAQYVTPLDVAWLTSQGTNGAAVFVESIKGAVRFVGLNSPFVTQTADQASTNSSVTLLGMTGSGLERVASVLQGQATIDDTTATLTGWALDGQNVGYDFHSRQIPTAVSDISATAWTKANDGADSNFVDYTCTSVIKCTKATRDATDYPNLGRSMKPIDLTSSQGDITGWHHEMQDCALVIPAVASTLAMVTNTKVAIANDNLISIPTTAGAAAVSQRAATTATQALVKDMYMSHNNVYRLGDNGPTHQELPPKTYLQLVPPPTVSANLTQDIFVQVILDVDMDVRIERDSMYNTAKTYSSKSTYVYKNKFLGDSQACFNGNCASDAA